MKDTRKEMFILDDHVWVLVPLFSFPAVWFQPHFEVFEFWGLFVCQAAILRAPLRFSFSWADSGSCSSRVLSTYIFMSSPIIWNGVVYVHVTNTFGSSLSRPGILVLINDADWELEGEESYQIQPEDNILFVSTLHGGWEG
jgi:hypothetical protein